MFFLVSVLAGVLTVLAPCILPLLPIVIGSAEGGKKISNRSLVVIFSLSFSVLVFTLLLKSSTLLIDIPSSFWSWFSGLLIIAVGFFLLMPNYWSLIPGVNKLNKVSNKILGVGYNQKNYSGDLLIGLALGPVFTTCSPTYLFIIATVLPVNFLTGFIYLVGFILGLIFSLLLIAYFGDRLVNILISKNYQGDKIKRFFGLLIIIVGLAILTGYDKKIETKILDLGYGATINFETELIKKFNQ